MAVLMAPTEPDDMGKLLEEMSISVITSSLPEEKGADYLVPFPFGIFPIQRKEIPHDFLLSVYDGRMARETNLLGRNKFRLLLCEGRFKFYQDGTVYVSGPKEAYARFKKPGIRKLILEIRLVKGVDVDWTEDIYDTASYIKDLHSFLNKEKHVSLYTRPPTAGEWGAPTTSEEWSWILQGFSGVGPGLADSMLKAFGKIPLKWDCDYEDLLMVPGIGGRRAQRLWKALDMPT